MSEDRVQTPSQTPSWGRLRAILAASWFGPLVISFSVLSIVVSLLVLTGRTGLHMVPLATTLVMGLNAITVLLLIALVLREIWALRLARRSGSAASRLHERVVRFFGFVAAIPVVIVSIVAFITIDRAFESVVTSELSRAVTASVQVADLYFKEQTLALRSSAAAMSNDVEQFFSGATSNQPDEVPKGSLKELLRAQAILRGFATVVLLKQDGTVIERIDLRPNQEFFPPGTALLNEVAKTSDVLAQFAKDNDQLEAIFRTHPSHDRFLYVVRPISRELIGHYQASKRGNLDLQAILDQRLSIQLTVAQTFILVALLVLLASVYIGLAFANRLVAPIRRLIGAANEVAAGNLNAEVHIRSSEGDLAQLGDTFNTMTRELQSQRQALVQASDQIDSRRRFTEAVLAGVSAGVIGLDDEGRITIANPTAAEFLGVDEASLDGQHFCSLAPEFAPLLEAKASQGQITLLRNGKERTLAVRLTSERDDTGGHGEVVTFDDVSELVVAQRSAAWADIARRIAHEIKNPLTPIQLSAERLRRRYGKVIVEDKDVFEQCTATIIRQVGDIGRMVDEFSSFARMPRAQFELGDVADTVKQVVFLMRMGNPDITIDAHLPVGEVKAAFDRRLISQCLTNLIKNASEALHNAEKGHIIVRLLHYDDVITLEVEDNGKGLPRENRQRLLEPYVTTREKGTGLGLAIVGRIVEEHGGRIELLDAPQQGALIRVTIKTNLPDNVQAEPTADKREDITHGA